MANLCFSSSLGSGLPPEKDCLKIEQLAVELLNVKVSKQQNRQFLGGHGARNSGPQRKGQVGQVVFFWFIGFRSTTSKRLLENWTTRSRVIKCQSLETAISPPLLVTTQGIADPKGKVRLAKLCFSGYLGSGLPPEKDCLKFRPLGVEL